MIGGRDIIISVPNSTVALEIAVRAVRRFWPSAVIEDAITGENLGNRAETNVAGRDEILVFRDQRSAELWNELGADPSLDGTLIHFLASEGMLTVAVDASPPGEIKSFVRKLRHDLRQGLLAKQK